MFKNVFSFKGRIRRTEFGLSYIIYTLTYYFLIFLISEVGAGGELLLFLLIPLLWFFFAQGAKRCHDRGNSGWYQIIPFYVFWMLFAESDPGSNQYGPNPKYKETFNEIDEIGKIDTNI